MAEAEEPPNVLWICADQQRFDTLGCYGSEHLDTPHIDQLAADGVRFERAYCQSTVCTPSRASFLTGRYPRTTGVRGNGQPIPETETLVTRLLADEGYLCGLSGKLHLSPTNADDEHPFAVNEPARRIDDGYAAFRWSASDYNDSPANQYLDWLRERGETYDPDPHPECDYVSLNVEPELTQTTWCAERAIDFVQSNENRDDPWLFSVNPIDPHHPWDPPEAYLEKYEERLEDLPTPNYEPGELDDKPEVQRRRARESEWQEMDEYDHRMRWAATYAMVDLIDDQVGQMLDALEETGQRENTVVIFMSDHGELHGDHGEYRKGPFFYDPSVRVPLVVDGPGVESGVDSNALVELVDVAPTLLDAADLDRPLGMQGRSLWPLLTGETSPSEHREDVYCEQYGAQRPYEFSDGRLRTMLRTDRYKLVRHHATDEGELYDMHEDPGETHNRYDDPDYREVRHELTTRLADRMAATADPEPMDMGGW